MARREPYQFNLEADDLDELRSALLSAQEFHLERARETRGATGPGYATAHAEHKAAADRCRRLWALLAGVRSVVCEGAVPVGPSPATSCYDSSMGGEIWQFMLDLAPSWSTQYHVPIVLAAAAALVAFVVLCWWLTRRRYRKSVYARFKRTRW